LNIIFAFSTVLNFIYLIYPHLFLFFFCGKKWIFKTKKNEYIPIYISLPKKINEYYYERNMN
jgi:hypothetical protein